MDLPSASAAASIVRGLGLYLRSAPVAEVPGELRRFRSFRPATLLRHRETLLDALEDADLRASVMEWLDDAHPKLPPADARNLRLAVERPDGWRGQLDSVAPPSASSHRPAQPARDVAVEAERARARSAFKRARQQARAELDAVEARAADLAKEVARLNAVVASARDSARRAETSAESAREELERERRKARREVEKARSVRDEHRTEARAARRALTRVKRELERMSRRVEELEQRSGQQPVVPPSRERQKPKTRRPLAAPKGRLPEDPQTLDEWLSKPRVHLLVDGYNAARAPRAFGDLDLEGQRERLTQEVFGLAVRKGVAATIVFDGAEVAPGTRRRRRGPVAIEYSSASETADDHMVASLQRLPPEPVIVVTNDRELQERAAVLGATIATSDQLMGLIR